MSEPIVRLATPGNPEAWHAQDCTNCGAMVAQYADPTSGHARWVHVSSMRRVCPPRPIADVPVVREGVL